MNYRFTYKTKIIMFFFISIILTFSYVYAATLPGCTFTNFTWLPSNEADVIGYKLYYSQTDGGPYQLGATINKVIKINGRVCGGIDGLANGQKYYFVSTAFTSTGIESGISNQTSRIIVNSPCKPLNLRVLY